MKISSKQNTASTQLGVISNVIMQWQCATTDSEIRYSQQYLHVKLFLFIYVEYTYPCQIQNPILFCYHISHKFILKRW